MTPRVSVLLSVYNGERHLRPALDSVLGQTLTDYEFLIIDDGSTDSTWAILSEYAAAHPMLELHRNPANLGITRSMNKLFARARGEYVTRHDADDVSRPERLERQAAYLDAHPTVGLLATRVSIIDEQGQPLDVRPLFNVGLTHAELTRELATANCLCQGSVMVRRTCLEQVGYYDESLDQAEDYDLWLRLAEVTQLAKLEEPLYCFRYHPDSVTRTHPHLTALDAARVVERTAVKQGGGQPAPERRPLIAERYLQAAIANWLVDEAATARRCLDTALKYRPALLAQAQPLERLVLQQVERVPAAAGVKLIGRVFDELLPPTRAARRVRARLLSDLHMRQVYRVLRTRQYSELDAHLWPAVRHNPGWLLNRGVLSIIARRVLHYRDRPAGG